MAISAPVPWYPQQGKAGHSEDDRLRRVDSGDLEEGLLALGQQVEDADSQSQVRVDQVGEPQDDEVDGHGNGLHAEQGGGPGKGRPGNVDTVRLQGPQKAEEHRNRPPYPHGRVLEEAVYQAVLVLAPDHRQPDLHYRIGEPFPLHPLAPQDHDDRHPSPRTGPAGKPPTRAAARPRRRTGSPLPPPPRRTGRCRPRRLRGCARRGAGTAAPPTGSLARRSRRGRRSSPAAARSFPWCTGRRRSASSRRRGSARTG